jgi:hypothetical protein
MVAAVVTPTRPADSRHQVPATRPADAFVAFGVTGDLAKLMALPALCRLERRGLLDCPVVGVSLDDWTVQQLRDHARRCIADAGDAVEPDVFDRFAARLSYVSGDFRDLGRSAVAVDRGDSRSVVLLVSPVRLRAISPVACGSRSAPIVTSISCAARSCSRASVSRRSPRSHSP